MEKVGLIVVGPHQSRNLIVRVDSDQVGRRILEDISRQHILTQSSNRGDPFTGPSLNNCHRLINIVEHPLLESVFLILCPLTDPIVVAEHQNVWSDGLPARGTTWNRLGLKAIGTNIDFVLVRIVDFPARSTLEMHDASMALHDFFIVEASFAKVVIDVASEDEVVIFHQFLADFQHVIEALMRLRGLVNVVPVAVKVPKFVRVFLKETWIGRICETHLRLAKVGVLSPEAFVTTEGWQS